MKTKILLLLLLLIFILGCSLNRPYQQPSWDRNLIIKHTLSGGFSGEISWLIICGDGRVGLSYPHLEGMLDPSELSGLINTFNQNNFFSLRGRYENRRVMDAGGVTISYSDGYKKKEVYVYGIMMPEQFKNVNQKLMDVREKLLKNQPNSGVLKTGYSLTLKRWPFTSLKLSDIGEGGVMLERNAPQVIEYLDGIRDLYYYYFFEGNDIYNINRDWQSNSMRVFKMKAKPWTLDIKLSSIGPNGIFLTGNDYEKVKNFIEPTYFYYESLVEGNKVYIPNLVSQLDGELPADFCKQTI